MRVGVGSWCALSSRTRGCARPGVSTPEPGCAAAALKRHGRSVWAPAGSCLLLRVSPAVRTAASHHWRRPGRFLRAGGEGAGDRGRARARAGTMRMRGPGTPPSGRGRTGAQLAWVRRAHIKGGPACFACLPRPLHCLLLLLLAAPGWRRSGSRRRDPQLRRGRTRELELASAESRRSSAPGRKDRRRGANAA